MEASEPDGLPEVGALARDLEEEPLLGLPAFGVSAGGELVVLVVGGD